MHTAVHNPNSGTTSVDSFLCSQKAVPKQTATLVERGSAKRDCGNTVLGKGIGLN